MSIGTVVSRDVVPLSAVQKPPGRSHASGTTASGRLGITKYLTNSGNLEISQRMANYESARTTGLYDRRSDAISPDEVERILL